MDFMEFIIEKAIILVPAIYIIGMIIKSIKFIPDRFIPLVLLIMGVGMTVWLLGFTPENVVQGILVTGAAVYSNQLFKQVFKKQN